MNRHYLENAVLM